MREHTEVPSPVPISFVWDRRDRYRTWTRLAFVGVPLTAVITVFGLPPADIHGPFHYLGVMSPTCGMTRGVMWLARGDLARAWMFNPGSLLVIPAITSLLVRAFHGYFTGRWLTVSLRWRSWLWVIPALLVLLLAIRQQLNADLLLANPAG